MIKTENNKGVAMPELTDQQVRELLLHTNIGYCLSLDDRLGIRFPGGYDSVILRRLADYHVALGEIENRGHGCSCCDVQEVVAIACKALAGKE